MNMYTGWEYLLIDLANQFGLDKLLFEERIEWATKNLESLEDMAEQAENRPLYIKACMAIRKAQQGQPTGHLVAFDACCSGIQIMSAITGCVAGAAATGMVDPHRRADAYSETTTAMNEILLEQGLGAVHVSRSDVKRAVMTSGYGSKAVPKEVFGADTPAFAAFQEAVHVVAPGAFQLLDELLLSWQPWALSHEWQLPDGFEAKIKVMEEKEVRIEVDELDHSTFTYKFKQNEGTERGRSNVANVIHSIDAYLLRCLVRRCNHDAVVTAMASKLITGELMARALGTSSVQQPDEGGFIEYYAGLYQKSGMADVVILPYLNLETITQLSDEHLRALNPIVSQMLEHKPFPIVSVHDAFASHANNCNVVRHWYKEVMAELAESTILNHILGQIYGREGTYPKRSQNLAEKIRQSNYALS